MKSLGNDCVLSARQLPSHLFVGGWPGTHTSLGKGANNCMGFNIVAVEDGDSISFFEVSARSITQSRQSAVYLFVAGNWLLNVLMNLQSNGMSLQKRIYRELFNTKTLGGTLM